MAARAMRHTTFHAPSCAAAGQRINQMSERASGAPPSAAEISATTPTATGQSQKWCCRPGRGSAAPQGQGRTVEGMREASGRASCARRQNTSLRSLETGSRQRCRKRPGVGPMGGGSAAAGAAAAGAASAAAATGAAAGTAAAAAGASWAAAAAGDAAGGGGGSEAASASKAARRRRRGSWRRASSMAVPSLTR